MSILTCSASTAGKKHDHYWFCIDYPDESCKIDLDASSGPCSLLEVPSTNPIAMAKVFICKFCNSVHRTELGLHIHQLRKQSCRIRAEDELTSLVHRTQARHTQHAGRWSPYPQPSVSSSISSAVETHDINITDIGGDDHITLPMFLDDTPLDACTVPTMTPSMASDVDVAGIPKLLRYSAE